MEPVSAMSSEQEDKIAPEVWLNFKATPEELERMFSALRVTKTTFSIALPSVKEKTDAGIIKHPDTIKAEQEAYSETASLLGVRIVGMSPDSPLVEQAYKIEIGDFVYLRPGHAPLVRFTLNNFDVYVLEWMYVAASRKWDPTATMEEVAEKKVITPFTPQNN